MECFLSGNKGSQADVLPWKPCIQANLGNILKQIDDSMLFISVQAELKYLENTLNNCTFSICEYFQSFWMNIFKACTSVIKGI